MKLFKSRNESKFKKKFTFVHLLILTFTLTVVLTFIAKNKMKEKQSFLDEQKYARIFDEIILGRRLDFQNDTDTICKKADSKLYDYYYTGKSEIDLSKFEFRNKSDQPGYIKALFDLLDSFNIGGGGDDEGDSDSGNSGDGAGGRRMEEEEEGGDFDIMGFAKSYGLHVIPGLLFIIVGIFSIFGWLICCCCACCNCCCKCCKKSKCKIPCLVISLVFNGLAIVASIIGLAKTNIFFTGVANTGCSLLQFINTVVSGEKKEELPKWVGVDGLDGLFKDIVSALTTISSNTNFDPIYTGLNTARTNLNDAINFNPAFDPIMDGKLLTIAIYYNNDDPTTYCFKKYIEQEIETTFGQSDQYIDSVYDIVKSMSDETISSIKDTLDDATGTLNDVKESITSITDQVSTYIVDYSDLIDNYGKLGFKVLFGFFTGLAAILALFIIIFFICSGGPCAKKCCCCHCFLKFLIVFFWNIAALFMVICFIIGGLLKFIGTIGDDLHVVISCLLGPESLGEGNSLIGEVSDYIYPCLHGEGDLSSKLNITGFGGFNNITNLTSVSSSIGTLKAAIKNALIEPYFLTDYSQKVTSANNSISNKCNNEEAINSLDCDDNLIVCNCFSDANLRTDGADVSACSEQYPYSLIESQFTKINEALDNINTTYSAAISQYEGALDSFNDTISELTGLIEKYAGKGNDAFAFLNCKFMGVNIKLVIHYIGEVIGKDIGIIGLMFILISCSMILVISGTILEMAIISISIKEKKEEIPEIPDNQDNHTDVVNSERVPIKPQNNNKNISKKKI